jgi:uncharacterized repeat protein (TIGR02543 family)
MCSERTRWFVAAALATSWACAPSEETSVLTAHIDGVEPACGDTSRATPIVVRGSLPVIAEVSLSDPDATELDTTYRAWLDPGAAGSAIALLDVVWRDPRSLTATIPASPAGSYALTLESPWGDRVSAAYLFEIRQGGCTGTPGALAVEASVAPNAVTVGQQVTVSAVVRNTGQRTVFDVEAAVTMAPSGAVPVGSQGAPRDLAGGGSATFTWTYTMTETTPTGGATFGITAAGVDDLGAPVAAPLATTNVLFVNPPANVTASTSAPPTANVAQPFTVTLTATNTGGAPALVAAVMGTSTPGVAWLSPAGQGIRVPPHDARSLAWTFTVDGPRDAAFSVGVTATDQNSGESLTVAPTPPVTVRIQRAATLVTTVAAAPAVVAESQAVTVVATVRNTGGATATEVSASMFAFPEHFTLLTSPQGQGTTLGENASAMFTWTYRADRGATVGTFQVDAAGVDENTDAEVTAPRATSNEVAAAYTVGGTVLGLDRNGLVLRNGGENLAVPHDVSTFTFAVPIASGARYEVAVASQPNGRTCFVAANAAGTVGAAAVDDVVVTCTRADHQLTAAPSPAGAAALSCGGAPCQPTYPDTTVPMEITYSANPGYTFDHWSGDCAGTGGCSVTMDQDRSVTATFTVNSYTLSRGTDPLDAGSVSCVGASCQASYPHGTEVELTATPAQEYEFDHWSGDCTGSGACSVTMDTARAVTAHFTLRSFLLTTGVNLEGAGSVSCCAGPSCVPVPCEASHAYPHGTVVDVTWAVNEGFTFTAWSGDCSGDGTCTVTMDRDRSVTAEFSAP